MAISNSVLLKLLSGQMNKEIVFKKYGDKTVVSKYPDMSKRTFTAKQKQVQEKMAEAHYEAKGIMANEALASAAQVRLNVTRNKLYTTLIKEYFKSQQVNSETAGNP
jgi:polyhydroxyalkanoate synthesis regulator protein